MRPKMHSILAGWTLAIATLAGSMVLPLQASASCPGDKKPSLTCPGDKKPSLTCPGDKKPSLTCPGDKKPSAL
jgi:hypothetical protein